MSWPCCWSDATALAGYATVMMMMRAHTARSLCVCVHRWVHLVCALYVPGVAFSNVDKLNGVTLFEMSYTKWGAKVHLVFISYLHL